MNKRILIACPICNREWVLPHYLKHIYNIDYDKKLIDVYWVVNNSRDKSLDMVKEFKEKYGHEYNSIRIEIYNSQQKFKDDRITQIREKYTYHWLSELRNKLLKRCVASDCDYLFSCDSDILVPSNILKKLLSHNEHMVAGLIYNGYLFKPPKASMDYDPIENAYKYPNILRGNVKTGYAHIVNNKVKNPNLPMGNSLTSVDFTGAVFLASQEACKVGKYSWHVQGEDEPFSRTVKESGFEIYCDLSCYSQHMMNERILELYLNGELKYANGEIIKIV